ncbi:hypothetical protein P9274_20185 [Schinkia azotoformans]|uniref:hypothetical protein n=1 Tax=Schinkia azotoformans TaxID=1454 RepID=UPI002E1B2731|nr:hypothetical protein [Schinkia azotoformans]
MAYHLQKLNVVKIVERADERDVLLEKGFKLIEETKFASNKKIADNSKKEKDEDGK